MPADRRVEPGGMPRNARTVKPGPGLTLLHYTTPDLCPDTLHVTQHYTYFILHYTLLVAIPIIILLLLTCVKPGVAECPMRMQAIQARARCPVPGRARYYNIIIHQINNYYLTLTACPLTQRFT